MITASFERLGLLLDQGERIRVTDGAGRELRGRLIDLSPSTLSLRVAGVRHDLREAAVAVIRRQRRDRLGNGALVGFLSGAAGVFVPIPGGISSTGFLTGSDL